MSHRLICFRHTRAFTPQGTHAQLGPGQEMVVRWASSHNNTFTFAVVAGPDEDIFFDPDFYA